MIDLLVTIVIVAIIAMLVFWVVEKIAIPQPFKNIIIAIVALVIVVYLLQMLPIPTRLR